MDNVDVVNCIQSQFYQLFMLGIHLYGYIVYKQPCEFVAFSALNTK